MSATPVAVTVDPLAPCPDFPPSEWAAVGAPLFPFELDAFQKHAVCAIARGENCLVTAKTGSGKTAVGEYLIAHALESGGRVFYTTPIKSLSNQKFSELKAKFKGRASVGIMTGDIKFAPDAQIIVLTQEILRNRLFKIGTSTANVGVSADLSIDGLTAVVFDEAHFMFDAERGHCWEETLMMLPRHVQCVLLSATMAAPEALCTWLAEVRNVRTTLLSTAYRVVPLEHGVLDPRTGDVCLIATEAVGFKVKVYNDWLKARGAARKEAETLQKQVHAAGSGAERLAIVASAKAAHGNEKPKMRSFSHELNNCVRNLEGKNLLPALFFVLNRKGCEEKAALIDHTLLTSSEASQVEHMFNFHLRNHKAELEAVLQYHKLHDLLVKGIAFHHSGVLPLMKEVIELLFSKGLVKALFATETFAVGLNMPTKTAVFLDVRKRAEGQIMRTLLPSEYTQMAGRAGRRGIDDKGLALYLPAHEPLDKDEMERMLTGSLVRSNSRLLLHYAFVLRVLQRDELSFDPLLNKSYYARQQIGVMRAVEADLVRLAAERRKIVISDVDRVICSELKSLSLAGKGLSNAARKDHQKLLAALLNKRPSPKWQDEVPKLFDRDSKLAEEERTAEAQLDMYRRPMSQTRLAPIISVLRALGFMHPRGGPVAVASEGVAGGDAPLEGAVGAPTAAAHASGGLRFADFVDGAVADIVAAAGGEATVDEPDEDLSVLDSKSLSLKGVLATEVNEGNPLLLPELYMWGGLREASAVDLMTVLGFFISDRDSEDKSQRIENLNFPAVVCDAHAKLMQVIGIVQRAEIVAGVTAPSAEAEFGRLDTLWADIGRRWCLGAGVRELCEEYEMFEGSFLRGIHKLSNLLTEWMALAQISEHLDVLDRLRDASATLLRGLAVADSLYLHM